MYTYSYVKGTRNFMYVKCFNRGGVESATDRHRGFFQLSERGAVPATLPLSYLLFLYVVVKCLKSLDVSEQIVHSNLSDL